MLTTEHFLRNQVFPPKADKASPLERAVVRESHFLQSKNLVSEPQSLIVRGEN